MRLLHTKDLRVQSFVSGKIPRHAILSHTWEDEEVTLQDMEKGIAESMKGYQKLKASCRKAAGDDYEWIWIDTCSIDKTSSAELSEAINSMFQYYSHAAICYAYLADVQTLADLEKSKWFTRGWTLQELLAPRVVIFFNCEWKKLGTKQSLSHEISSITGIPEDVILGRPVQECNIGQRMSWASQRQTTREEDVAYCLLGLFDIHMPPIYGEGAEKAFLRLQEEILHQSADHSLFIWTPAHDPFNHGLLASSPKPFCTHPHCFAWMEIDHDEKQGFFNPYSYLRRTSDKISERMYKFEQETGMITVTTVMDPDYSAFTGLQQSGLHVSLLSHTWDKREISDKYGHQYKTVNFDLTVYTPGNNLGRPVLLTFMRDMHARLVSLNDFSPNRLGAWRRTNYSDPGALYYINTLTLSLKRTNITVSQLPTLVPYSGPALTFSFNGAESEALVSDMYIADSEGYLTAVPRPDASFQCHGGIVILRHSCRECDPLTKAVLCFGGQGTVFKPWCYLGLTRKLVGAASPLGEAYKTYESVRCSNARHSVKTSTPMECRAVVDAQIDFRADENCYLIKLSQVYSLTAGFESRSAQGMVVGQRKAFNIRDL